MIARPKSQGTEHTHKSKGERPKKPSKVDGGKNKTSKKDAGSAKGGGAAVRGQSQSCHQCRQSIHSSKGVSEVKSGRERLKCSQCTRYWCEQCLQNRYGVVKCEQDPTSWVCPVCNNICNCSLCRRKAGKLATGILTPLVKSAGFGSVSDFLDKGTDDIAKVLQWKSPEIAAAPAHAKSKQRSVCEEGGKVKAKKRKRPSPAEDAENSKSLANTPSPINGCPGDHSSGRCHRGSGRPKRRRLSHSSYSITFEEEPLDLDTSGQAKVVDSTTPLTPSGSLDGLSNDRATAGSQVKGEMTFGSRDGDNNSTLSKSESEAEESSPYRRSQRKRTTTKRYSSHDFRPMCMSDEEDNLEASPRRKRRRGKDNVEKRVSFKSPPYSPPTCHELTAEDGDVSDEQNVDFLTKQKELEELRISSIHALRESREMSRQKLAEEKARLRDEARKKREEEKQMILEEKAKLKQEKRLKKIATQEKLKLARNLLREAQKDSKRRQKEREKVRKQQELHLLKEKRQSEKRRKQELTSAPILRASNEVCTLKDDSPADCEAAGLPSLPVLSSLDLSLSSDMIPRFFFVSEFLFTFADALDLKRRLSVKELSKLMAGGRGLGDLYLALLQVLVDEDSQLQKHLKPSKRQRELEVLARTYLHDVGKNGFVKGTVSVESIEDSLTILHHLCEEALDSPAVLEHMEACHEQIDQLRREERQREREKSREISEQLKELCDGGSCSLEDIEAKRREFTKELEEMRKTSEQEQLLCRLAIRNTCLGQDRYDRIFWKLQSFPGLVVEVVGGGGGGLDADDCPAVLGGNGELPLSEWLTVNSTEQLEQLMAALHPQGRREKQLRTSLTVHKDDIVSQMKQAGCQARVKKFYGSV